MWRLWGGISTAGGVSVSAALIRNGIISFCIRNFATLRNHHNHCKESPLQSEENAYLKEAAEDLTQGKAIGELTEGMKL